MSEPDIIAPGKRVPAGSIQAEVNRLTESNANLRGQLVKKSTRCRRLEAALRDMTATAPRAIRLLEDDE